MKREELEINLSWLFKTSIERVFNDKITDFTMIRS